MAPVKSKVGRAGISKGRLFFASFGVFRDVRTIVDEAPRNGRAKSGKRFDHRASIPPPGHHPPVGRSAPDSF